MNGFTWSGAQRATVAMISGLSAWVAAFVGGFDALFTTLTAFMVSDYVAGFLCGLFGKSHKTESGGLSSRAGFRGLVKKFSMVLMVGLANQVDAAAGIECFRDAVALGLIVNEGLSIVENLGALGVKIPTAFRNMIDEMQKKEEGEK